MARSTRSLAVCAVIAIGALVTLTAPAAPAGADAGTGFTGASGATGARPLAQPGGAGLGDPYFPKDGNGGYDVAHYELDVRYEPATDGCAASPRSAPGRPRTCRGSTSTSTA